MPAEIHIQHSPFPEPTQSEVDFVDSSFFNVEASQKRRNLPAPTDVLARSKDFKIHSRPVPIRFEHLNLIVKFGFCVMIEEALLRALRTSSLVDKVPAPEVYGWRVRQGVTFIYMELIQGDTLLDRWDHLSNLEKTSICAQLREATFALRQVGQVPGDNFIGSLNHQSLGDYVFRCIPNTGPFDSVKDFNDWFSSLPQSQSSDSLKYRDPYRDFLPDTGTIKLTHGDLHRGNIIISSTKAPRVVAIIDWAHAGWYPEYWEYCKALYTAHYEDEWRKFWIPEFLTPYETEFDVFWGVCIANRSSMNHRYHPSLVWAVMSHETLFTSTILLMMRAGRLLPGQKFTLPEKKKKKSPSLKALYQVLFALPEVIWVSRALSKWMSKPSTIEAHLQQGGNKIQNSSCFSYSSSY